MLALRDALDGEDVGAVMAQRERKAGIDPLAVDQDGAGAALAAVASLLGSGQIQLLTQEIEERRAGVSQRDIAPQPFTVRLMEWFMQGSDQCYGRAEPCAAARGGG